MKNSGKRCIIVVVDFGKTYGRLKIQHNFFNNEISEYLIELARIKNQSIQDLAQELMQEAIEIEKEDMALAELAAKRSGAERVKLEDVKWE